MNYRHSFHAGNFADVLKHIVLLQILAHLSTKSTPFRVIDTHAGAGLYNLASAEAARTGEWRSGVAHIRNARLSTAAEAVIAPYREAVAAFSQDGMIYPGSPALIRRALRGQDHAIFNERHPETLAALREAVPAGARIGITGLDAYMAWKAQVPPSERRGLVLVDPPFEKPDEFLSMASGLEIMARKWASGIAMLWFPVKNTAMMREFETRATQSGFDKLLWVELHVDDIHVEGPLSGCGLLIANPPWTLHAELTALLPELSALLARSNKARWQLEWLKGP